MWLLCVLWVVVWSARVWVCGGSVFAVVGVAAVHTTYEEDTTTSPATPGRRTPPVSTRRRKPKGKAVCWCLAPPSVVRFCR
jgi:hypothetical protein